MKAIRWFFADFINPQGLHGEATSEDVVRIMAWVAVFFLVLGLTACADDTSTTTNTAQPAPDFGAVPLSSMTEGIDYFAYGDCAQRIEELQRQVDDLREQLDARLPGRSRRSDGNVLVASATGVIL
ncbi:MAG: hypothetical protein HKM24_04440 [Gammaproteobacteria bacterium]|nr:hypothetical protein [Gammaproteobacteria bacterium]